VFFALTYETQTFMTQTSGTSGSSGARALALLLIGLFLGVMVSVVVMQASQQKSGYADGLMAVLQQHHNLLRQQVHRGSCETSRVETALHRLQMLAPDIVDALSKRGSLVQEMTDDLIEAARVPADAQVCEYLPKLVTAVEQACKACHSQLR
jgi:uncharacterized protein HemX